MGHKLQQNIVRFKHLHNTVLPNKRSRVFFFKYFDYQRRPGRAQTIITSMLVNQSQLFFKNRQFRVRSRFSCFMSSRSRGVNRRFHISRLKYKHFMHLGMLLGFKKSSW